MTYGHEVRYIDIRDEKLVLHDKGWALDPYDQDMDRPYLMTSLNDTEPFQAHIWVYQLMLHLFLPVSLPWIAATRGIAGLRKQNFLPSEGKSILTMGEFAINSGLVCPLLLFISGVIYTFHQQELCMSQVGLGEWFIGLLMVSVHRGMVALKYASMSIKEYQQFWDEPDVDLAREWNNQVQLMTGYIFGKDEYVKYELELALGRSALTTLKTPVFCITNPNERVFRAWQRFLAFDPSKFDTAVTSDEELLIDTSHIKVSVEKVCRCIVQHSRERSAFGPAFGATMMFLSVTIACIPLILRALCVGYDQYVCLDFQDEEESSCGARLSNKFILARIFGSNPLVVTCVCCTMYVRFYFMQITSIFILSVITDMSRVVYIQEDLALLLRPPAAVTETATVPCLPMAPSANVKHWSTMRWVLGEYAARQRTRFQAYYAAVTLGVLVLTVYVLSIIAFSDGESSDHLYFWPALWCFLILLVFWFGVTVSAMLSGEAAVKRQQQQTLHLTRFRSQAPSIVDVAEREVCLNYVQTAIELNTLLQEFKKITLLGIEATASNAYTLFTGVLTVLAYIALSVFGIEISN